MNFIQHSLMLLEDAGMSVDYPEVDWIRANEARSLFATSRPGRRVLLEQNQHMKLMMVFSVLDFHIDVTYPDMEGKSFRQKYKSIPSDDDYDLMFRELFRVAKVMRNSLVHNSSSFSIVDGYIDINYSHNKTPYRVRMTLDAVGSFYTAIVMYLKSDLGDGPYFLGIMRSIYSNFVAGIEIFSDEFTSELLVPPEGIKLNPYRRVVRYRSEHQVSDGLARILVRGRVCGPMESADFHIVHGNVDYLVPLEALSDDLSIGEYELIRNWKYVGTFPPLRSPADKE
ncbi:hypothetical protein L2Y96_19175 [Luteibacter aegosomaticola]|uniref:hypothetical protein n=1 Tax=Luteibacter aegosomaticola TaxID=2911538 RepID=UPI001FF8C0BC|nr:hypothetical protein [Luteibacter aegosomaticola]UPG89495.1 hypothetical protein L2Y96_19175 [Luteibacter aegosomaticola]